jgi:hypothetical protein
MKAQHTKSWVFFTPYPALPAAAEAFGRPWSLPDMRQRRGRFTPRARKIYNNNEKKKKVARVVGNAGAALRPGPLARRVVDSRRAQTIYFFFFGKNGRCSGRGRLPR